MFDSWNNYGTQSAFVAITTIIILAPVLRYVVVGWKYKSRDITNSIDDHAKQIYLERFQKQIVLTTTAARAEFGRQYHGRFGRRYFAMPVLILAILVLIEASLAI